MARLTPEKAGLMLKEGTARGKPLTGRQKRYFGFIRGGGKPTKLMGKARARWSRIKRISKRPKTKWGIE